MSLPKILVIYKEKECTRTLSQLLALVQYMCPLGEISEKQELSIEDIKEGQEYDVHISTKYYDADAQIVFYHYHPDDIDDIVSAVDNLNVVIHLFEQEEELDDYLKFVLAFSKKVEAEMSLLVHNSEKDKLEDKYEKLIHTL